MLSGATFSQRIVGVRVALCTLGRSVRWLARAVPGPAIACGFALGTVNADVAAIANDYDGARAGSTVVRAADGRAAHRYAVHVRNDLEQVLVVGRLDGPERWLRVRETNVAAKVTPLSELPEHLRPPGCGVGTLHSEGSGFRLRGGACFAYRVRLPDEARMTIPGYKLTPPSRWLLLPRLEGDDSVRIDLRLPEDVRAAVPWPERTDALGAHYVLATSPRSARGLIVLGHVESFYAGTTGIRVDVVEPNRFDTRTIEHWLVGALDALRDVAGVLPNPDAKILVLRGQDRRGRGSPVPFGRVVRDGGEVVQLFVDPDASLESLKHDWTAVHELAHLLLPYVQDRQKWVSEGFASYYQNLMLARLGEYSEREMWRRFRRSFAQAEMPNAPALTQLHTRSFWDVRMLTYWGGAAFAMRADVLLRDRSNGDTSLDTVLGRLAACCLPSARRWSASELMTKLDELSETSVFTGLYQRAQRPYGVLPVDQLFRQLGVPTGSADVDTRAPLAGIRAALVRRRNTESGASGVRDGRGADGIAAEFCYVADMVRHRGRYEP